MKTGLSWNFRTIGITIFILIIGSPIFLIPILAIADLINSALCRFLDQCSPRLTSMIAEMGFGLIFLLPIMMLFGALGSVVYGAYRGILAFKKFRKRRSMGTPFTKLVGLVCVGLLAYLIYIPRGPDPCSRVITDTQYEACLEAAFADLSFEQAIQWLKRYGYNTNGGGVSPLKKGGPWRGYDDGEFAFMYDRSRYPSREYGPFRTVPYGTNFNRMFARVWPAPNRFQLNIYGLSDQDMSIRVQVWWAFSFL